MTTKAVTCTGPSSGAGHVLHPEEEEGGEEGDVLLPPRKEGGFRSPGRLFGRLVHPGMLPGAPRGAACVHLS